MKRPLLEDFLCRLSTLIFLRIIVLIPNLVGISRCIGGFLLLCTPYLPRLMYIHIYFDMLIGNTLSKRTITSLIPPHLLSQVIGKTSFQTKPHATHFQFQLPLPSQKFEARQGKPGHSRSIWNCTADMPSSCLSHYLLSPSNLPTHCISQSSSVAMHAIYTDAQSGWHVSGAAHAVALAISQVLTPTQARGMCVCLC